MKHSTVCALGSFSIIQLDDILRRHVYLFECEIEVVAY